MGMEALIPAAASLIGGMMSSNTGRRRRSINSTAKADV